MENRNGLVVGTELTAASRTAERTAAGTMVDDLPAGQQITVGGDKAHDTKDFVADMRDKGATPHVSQNTKGRRSATETKSKWAANVDRNHHFGSLCRIAAFSLTIIQPDWPPT